MWAMRLLLLGWHREHRPLREHLRGRPDRQHVLAASLIETIAQPRVLAVGVIAEHRRLRAIPARGGLHQLDPGFGLVLKATVSGIFVFRRRVTPAPLTHLGERSELRMLSEMRSSSDGPSTVGGAMS